MRTLGRACVCKTICRQVCLCWTVDAASAARCRRPGGGESRQVHCHAVCVTPPHQARLRSRQCQAFRLCNNSHRQDSREWYNLQNSFRAHCEAMAFGRTNGHVCSGNRIRCCTCWVGSTRWLGDHLHALCMLRSHITDSSTDLKDPWIPVVVCRA